MTGEDDVRAMALAEIAATEQRLAVLRDFVSLYEELGCPSLLASNQPPRRCQPIRAADFEAALRRIFDEIGRPLSVGELRRELESRGMRLGTGNMLNTKLSRAKHLVGIMPDGRRWLVGRRLPDTQEDGA